MQIEKTFIEKALSNPVDYWEPNSFAEISARTPPDLLFQNRKLSTQSDIYRIWATWFVESFTSPQVIADSGESYPYVVKRVRESIEQRIPHATNEDRSEICSTISRALYNAAKRIRESKARTTLTLAQRHELIDLSGPKPYCAACGFRFSEETIGNFLQQEPCLPKTPSFVDVLTPRGLSTRDLNIEIDHTLPFSRGGGDGDNLQILCGWCNSAKSNHQAFYDVSAQPKIPQRKNEHNIRLLPHRFWSVKTLLVNGGCELDNGNCGCTSRDGELRIYLKSPEGSPNPFNLGVTCKEHDPFKESRFISIESAKRIWKK